MMNYLALLLTSYLLNGPWKDPNPLNVVAQTPRHRASAALAPHLRRIFASTGAPSWPLLVAFAVYWLLWKTTLGFEIRTVGAEPQRRPLRGHRRGARSSS